MRSGSPRPQRNAAPANKRMTRRKDGYHHRSPLRRPSAVILVVLQLLLARHPPTTEAFVGHTARIQTSPATKRVVVGRRQVFVLASHQHDNDETNTNDNDDNDLDWNRDFQRAKQQKLGRSIPREQARETAVDAENEFLSAMREARDEFQQAKQDLGSDGAVDLFLGRIRKEDERREYDKDDEEEEEEDEAFQ